MGLKLVSILRRDVDIQSLTVSDPHVYLIIGSDGRTNIPEPKVRRTSKTSTMEDILKLAIGRFNLERGIFEVEARSRIPFAARGENLNVRLAYDLLGPRYRGTVAIQPSVCELRRLRTGAVCGKPGRDHGEEPHRGGFRERSLPARPR